MPRKTGTSPAPTSASPAPVYVLHPGTVPEPARKLGKDGRALWDKLHRDYEITDEAAVEMVLQCCQAVDLAESVADARSELAARNFVVKTLRNLFGEQKRDRPGRPPGKGSPW